MLTAPGELRRVAIRISGSVQGVGFRPYVFRLADSLRLSGFVLNDQLGVLIEVEGDGTAVSSFLERVRREAPPLATIDTVSHEELPATRETGFRIATSAADGERATPVAPDSASCPECIAELFDAADRRFRYPFINCTNCGPRFTIVTGSPYDRARTSMAEFTMCSRCRDEFDDPRNRRFHAQPNCCPDCGPAARLVDSSGRTVADGDGDAIAAAARALTAGAIVAVKGLGGYHLACRADSEKAVGTLRARKHREHRPFALMAPDLAAARTMADLLPAEEALLISRARPIVLSRRRMDAPVASAVAPRSRDIGVMLPYTPLHHLLLADVGMALVMTSGNVSDEPISFRDDDALTRLAPIADCFLMHDRRICTRTDDSVVRVVSHGDATRPQLIRRSRGYVPESIELPAGGPPLLACGAELKSTFCVAKGARAWMSHHIGDLKNYETLTSYREGVAHFERMFAVQPEIVAHDLHPDYLSTAYAMEREGVELLGVQHHHAHLAACLAEHGESGPAVGAIFDGSGYGSDGSIWGGEFLVGGLDGFVRSGHLWPVRMPGGDRAVSEPWRMACSWLGEASRKRPELPRALRQIVTPKKWAAVATLAETGIAAPVTSSIGRLFDAVAAICGVCAEAQYEGQAAIELEALADRGERDDTIPVPGIHRAPGENGIENLVLDPREMILAIESEADAGVPPSSISARFHEALASGTAAFCGTLAHSRGISTIVLSGGVFQNRLLLERTTALLMRDGFRVLTPERIPANDAGIAYGQAAVAAWRGLTNSGRTDSPTTERELGLSRISLRVR